MHLYNTLTRKKETFVPIEPGKVRVYCCGPTVYDYAHIGNLRTYIFEDLLKRILMRSGFDVLHIMNITDVGHLTSDADEGEDKLLKAIRRENLPVSPDSMLIIAKKYADAFRNDIRQLHILDADVFPKATEHVQEMIELIKRLESRGYTYKTSTAIMFDISKFANYAGLARLNLSGQKTGAREEVIKDTEKRNPQDFALWFFGKPTHVMQWDSPWGKGFPGWHIECSAMSWKHLGDQFDIHCGGVDHIPVHHTNEIAQSECALQVHPWVKYWLHGEFLTVKSEKMAKSAGTFITLQNIIDKGFDPLDYRYFCLFAHYRSHLNFDWEALENARNAFARLRERVLDLKANPTSNPTQNTYQDQFNEAIYDDLNIPIALSVFWAVLKDDTLGNKEKLELLVDFDTVFGLGISDLERESLPANLMKLIEEREAARNSEDWKRSDKLRDILKTKGILIEDTPHGPKWKRTH